MILMLVKASRDAEDKYLAGVFAPHLRSCTQHVWSGHPPVTIITTLRIYSHIHST